MKLGAGAKLVTHVSFDLDLMLMLFNRDAIAQGHQCIRIVNYARLTQM